MSKERKGSPGKRSGSPRRPAAGGDFPVPGAVAPAGRLEADEQLQVEVTRRSLAEQELQRRGRLLEAFFKHSTTPLVFLDRRFNFLRVNEAYARACQKSVNDFPGHNHFEFYPHPENQAIFEHVVQSKKPFHVYAKPFTFPDHPEWGVTYWDWTLTPLLDEKGEFEFLVFSLKDVTAQTLAAEQVRDSSLYARSLLEAGLDPFVAISPQGKITDLNKATEEATGLSREKLVGSDFADYFTEPENAREAYRRALAEGYVRHYPLTIRHASGRTTDVLYHATVYRNQAGEVQGVFASARDVTDLKSANAALEAYAAQLRRLALELTQAEHRERRRLARMLHDHLQQLLVGAKFRLGMIERSSKVSIRRAALEVEDLISQSIAASRTLTGELSPPILHEGGLVPALEWLAGWMKDKQGLAVELRADEQHFPGREDVAVLLYQAVRELLFNAVKHAGVKAARVQVQHELGQVRIVVSDEGRGFDPSRLRVGGAGKGTGLGLFGLRERLTLLGGRMEVDTAPGRGSRFTLVAPIELPDQQAEPGQFVGQGPPQPAAAAPGGAAAPGKKIRVLLADDHAVTRQGLARLLREEGDFDVVGEAADGHVAIDLARKLRPDVVVMDIGMPGMGGVEATRLIHDELPGVRVVGLSMFEEAQRAAALRQAGAAAYVAKSGSPDVLIDTLRECCRSPGAPRKPVSRNPGPQEPDPRNPLPLPKKAKALRRSPRARSLD